ncbi:Protein javelin, partial [Lucilia cuprina]
KSKEFIYNYVDRVRFAESSFPDYKCPSRGSGWRHNKSISHLDLATSCHSAAAGLNHWSSSHQTRHHQLRHSRSLDYNHIDRCKDALDIAEYYWRVEPEPEIYDEEEEEEEEEVLESEHQQQQQPQQQQQQQLKYVSEHHLTQHYRDFKCADENYHHSTNNIYQSSQQLQQQQQQQQQHQLQQQPHSHQTRQQNLQQQQHPSNNGSIPPQPFEFASDSCSLRRSRSLAVIREETFSDLQISSSNGSRRSQLIPRARLVNRGYFRERERLICGNNKHHHHHHTSREKLTTNCNCSNSGCNSTSGGGGGGGQINGCYCQDLDEQSTESIAETCDSHQQQLQLLHQKQQQQQQLQQQQQSQHLHYHPHYHELQSTVGTTATTNDYYEHLKRLDKLALGLVTEQLHPWHNDKSDLESLNSDYFKNSLHQTSDLKQQHHQQQHHLHQLPHQQQQLEFETFEQAVQLLAQEKPRIYQSRRQKRSCNLEKSHKQSNSTPASGGESCPENSQSSVFPETTTSNSDDQTDSASLSEQEYDITKIEEIFQKTQIEGDEESYEIISLTTTTRTRFETTEDEAEDPGEEEERERERDRFLEKQINSHRFRTESDAISKEGEGEEEADDTEESNRHTTTDTEIEGTLKRARAVSDNLQKIIAYDSVYLSSEESSDSTLIDVDGCDTSLEAASVCTCIDEVETLLHISIEDTIYEPQAKQHKFEVNCKTQEKPETVSFVETVNTKIEIIDHCDDLEAEDIKPIYTQILKIEHTPCSSTLQQQHTTTIPAGVTSSAASKPKILSVVEKRKLKRYSDSAYSSNVSDSSEKGLTPPNATDSSSGSSGYTHASHLKRQVAEPLYIPLKSNLSDNQYHSLPDVNIGQILKVSESIDAQLRSSYNLDNCCSLDDTVDDCHLQHDTSHTSSLASSTNHCNNNNNTRQFGDEVVTTEEIYDSIKRFGRAHQEFKQKECQVFELHTEKEEEQHQLLKEDSWSSDNSFEIPEDKYTTPIPQPSTPDNCSPENTDNLNLQKTFLRKFGEIQGRTWYWKLKTLSQTNPKRRAKEIRASVDVPNCNKLNLPIEPNSVGK